MLTGTAVRNIWPEIAGYPSSLHMYIDTPLITRQVCVCSLHPVGVIGRTSKLALLQDWSALGDSYPDSYSHHEGQQAPGSGGSSGSGGGCDSPVSSAVREVTYIRKD